MLKETLVLIGQTLNKRQTNKEKLTFINAVAEPLLKAGIKVELHRNPAKKVKSNNIHIDDLAASDTIVVAGYDTGSKMLGKHIPYYPLKAKKNQRYEKQNLLFYAGITLAAVIIMFAASLLLLKGQWYSKFAAAAIDGAMILVLYYSLRMSSAAVNMNRNSAACALLFELAKKQRKATAFVYTDQSIQSYLGYLQLAGWFADLQGHRFIILDALSSGAQLYVAGRGEDKYAQELAQQLNAVYRPLTAAEVADSPLRVFDHSLLVFCADMNAEGELTVVSRSKEDYRIDVERLERILQVLDAALK